MLVAIRAPKTNERGPANMERALAAVHKSIGRQELTLAFGTIDQHVGLFCAFPDALKELIHRPIAAKYPNCTLEETDDSSLTSDDDSQRETWSAGLSLTPEIFPILRYAQFGDTLSRTFEDPLESLLSAIEPDGDSVARIEISITPASSFRRFWAKRAVNRLDRPFFRSHIVLADLFAKCITHRVLFPLALLLGLLAPDHRQSHQLDMSATGRHEREDDVQAASDKIGGHLFETRIRLIVTAPKGQRAKAKEKLRILHGTFGAFTKARWASFRMSNVRQRSRARGRSFLLSAEEIATIFHPATMSVEADKMAVTEFTELEAPVSLASGRGDGEAVVGCIQYGSDKRAFGISKVDRRRHLYIVGKTGMGKTTLLENLIRSDIDAGHGVAVIDPHGDLFEAILDAIPSRRTNDVIVFDPADSEVAIAFNPLACADPSKTDLVASGVVSAFHKLYDSWGPRLEDTLRNAVYAAIEHGGTLQTIVELLTDDVARGRMTMRLSDPIARDFWQLEFERWNDRYRTEAVASILNKLRPFLMSQSIRSIVSQEGRSLDLRSVMDEGRVLLVNLSKGLLGEDNANLLGALIVTSLQQAAMSRADVSEESRQDFYCYIDEFQNFTTGSFAAILSEARKYRLNLTLAHQYLAQIDEPTADAIFGNVGSIISFQVGTEDAIHLSRQLSKFQDQVKVEDLTNLPKYHAYMRLLHDGMPQPPFSIHTLKPLPSEKRGEVVRRTSNARYGRKRDTDTARTSQSSTTRHRVVVSQP